jgi:hypothetical protein
MARNTHNIVPNLAEGMGCKAWRFRKSYCSANTKAEAEKIARQIIINQGTELVIHGKDGRIQRSDSHGNDPCPPKDGIAREKRKVVTINMRVKKEQLICANRLIAHLPELLYDDLT